MGSRAIIATLLSALVLFSTACDVDIEYKLVNKTDTTIDILVFTDGPIFVERWLYYSALEIGQVDVRIESTADDVLPEAIVDGVDIGGKESRLRVIARDARTSVMVFRREFTQKELKAMGGLIELTDMR